ncbi:toll/interleukin-1 receptor domain-containing protein [Bacillus wiedmannii]|uniref:toll/interleukin-1 receptor domain-containing protein n=1 Tax=Bacillus wiedmannii TaxID=1890302 RepID=UPI0015CF6406|nr:toll/interleukin-1 receptor domain-containing protein [Bacillus wiedmannii]
MRKISITIVNNKSHIRYMPLDEGVIEDGFCVDFFINKENVPQKELLPIVRTFTSDIDWITWTAGNLFLNLSKMKEEFQSLFNNCEWMKGEVKVEPQFDEEFTTGIPIVTYQMTKNQVEQAFPKKIFLSHKGSNKDLVKKFYEILTELGFDPWLDEEDMHAVAPNRGILKGFQESCACIFFITPEFKDEKFLTFEIDCAQRQNMDRGERFRIITLQFTNEKGVKGVVPDLLQISLWKVPKNDMEALKYIIRGLPIKVGTVDWK